MFADAKIGLGIPLSDDLVQVGGQQSFRGIPPNHGFGIGRVVPQGLCFGKGQIAHLEFRRVFFEIGCAQVVPRSIGPSKKLDPFGNAYLGNPTKDEFGFRKKVQVVQPCGMCRVRQLKGGWLSL